MPAKNASLTLTYTAWDTANNVGKTGDAANHTLKVVVDGTEQAVAATPAEVDGTNAKGEYKVVLTSANMNGNMVKFCGASSTSGIVIVPVPIFTDGGVLPASAAPGASGGLPTVDGSNGVKLSVGTGTGQVNSASGKVPATVGSSDYSGNTAQTGDAFAALAPFAGTALTATVGSVTDNSHFALVFDAAYDGNATTLGDGTILVSFTSGLNHLKSQFISTGTTLADSTHAGVVLAAAMPYTVATGNRVVLITN